MESGQDFYESGVVDTETNPATPLKLLSLCSLSAAEVLHPVTPKRSCATAECIEIPDRLSDWKLHKVGSKVTLYRLLGMPDERPPICVFKWNVPSHVLNYVFFVCS